MTMATGAVYRLTVCLAALGLAVASDATSATAACADCATVTFNANLQVTKLHPSVTAVELTCRSPGSDEIGKSGKLPVVDHGFTGSVTVVMTFSAAYIISRPDYRAFAYCELWLESPLAPGRHMAVALAAQPLLVTDPHWYYVATGSTVSVAKELTFPNAAAP
jgi:hypothetical protein